MSKKMLSYNRMKDQSNQDKDMQENQKRTFTDHWLLGSDRMFEYRIINKSLLSDYNNLVSLIFLRNSHRTHCEYVNCLLSFFCWGTIFISFLANIFSKNYNFFI
ncbi:hypothetical protein EDEG_01123 [Edhazardia aedis USNM 41457]|uniref:Uncharacterized protein n=1 Tax=Edhazardia aedis (strain USNM 41457) TaxID=1003232 RepID=J9DQ49_EDHAE|nr:hypothetical protein EDEG_01123 [Edhazardia aedis USNM 41457]|eukprot:EJW04675.1 hypothetical protein EDEG_01123 [Edhazardia aedis USNM 41457]